VERYGERCWELDALNPNTLRAILRREIEARIERTQWDRDGLAEVAETESLTTVLSNWQAILNQGSE
jgi:hypothetical protein